MRATLELGAELDIATPAELRAELERAMAPTCPIVKKPRDSEVMPNAGVAILDLGSPPAGQVWDVRNVFVSGADPTATVANAKAVICAGAPPVTGTLVGALDAFAGYALLASIANGESFSRNQLTIVNKEHLFVIVSGAANGTNLAAVAQAIEEPVRVNVRQP